MRTPMPVPHQELDLLTPSESWLKNTRPFDISLEKTEPVETRVCNFSRLISDTLSHSPRYSRNPRRPAGPVQLLDRILKTWQLGQLEATALLGLEPSDEGYVADVLAGRKHLKGRDANDRLGYLILMRMALSEWFRNESVENEWLREPQEVLDGKVPMDLLLEGSMENLLVVKEYIDAATGW